MKGAVTTSSPFASTLFRQIRLGLEIYPAILSKRFRFSDPAPTLDLLPSWASARPFNATLSIQYDRALFGGRAHESSAEPLDPCRRGDPGADVSGCARGGRMALPRVRFRGTAADRRPPHPAHVRRRGRRRRRGREIL